MLSSTHNQRVLDLANKIGLDVALKDARTRSKASVDDIWRFAKICRVANVIRPYLESVG